MNPATKKLARRISFGILAVAAIVIISCTHTKPAGLNEAGQLTFKSPDDAVQGLVDAMRADDTKKLQDIFGPDSDDLLFSGDSVDDKLTLSRFLNSYDQKHSLTQNDDGSMTIVVGNNDWPMPIPLVKDDSGNWIYDTADGKDEVLARRVGRNELSVIQVCQAICDAEREYAQRDPNGDNILEYAKKFISDPGKTNGLYWPTATDEPPSPLGIEAAEAQGYSADPNSATGPRPFHGYLYRILTAQGKDAPGGAMDYIVNGKFIGGYAVVAWPVNYGNSGIMSFIVDYDGVVYQKDLGDDTDKIARAMTEYNPDSTWKKAE